MDVTAERVLEYLTGVEEAAEDVLSDKEQVTLGSRNCYVL